MGSERGPEFIFICSPSASGDPGDLLALSAVRALHGADVIEAACVVTTGTPAYQRACYAADALHGERSVPVGAGTDVGERRNSHGLDGRFARRPDTDNGIELMRQKLSSARGQVHLVITSAFSDAARLVSEHPRLVAEHVARVTLLGGADASDAASTNRQDYDAARTLYSYLRNEAIPTSVIPEDAVVAHSVPVAVLARIGQWGDLRASWLIWRALIGVPRGVDVERSDSEGPGLAVPIGALVALTEALRAARGEPEFFAMEGERFQVCHPSPDPARVVERQIQLLQRGLLGTDDETRRQAIERIAIVAAGSVARGLGVELPEVAEAGFDATHRSVGITYRTAIAPPVASACEGAVAEAVNRELGEEQLRVIIRPTDGEITVYGPGPGPLDLTLRSIAAMYAARRYMCAGLARYELCRSDWSGAGMRTWDVAVCFGFPGALVGRQNEDGIPRSCFTTVIDDYAPEADRVALAALAAHLDAEPGAPVPDPGQEPNSAPGLPAALEEVLQSAREASSDPLWIVSQVHKRLDQHLRGRA